MAQAMKHAVGGTPIKPHRHSTGRLYTSELSDEEDDEEPLRTAAPSAHGPRLRNDARSDSCVSVWHDAIPKQCHRAALEADADQPVMAGRTHTSSERAAAETAPLLRRCRSVAARETRRR